MTDRDSFGPSGFEPSSRVRLLIVSPFVLPHVGGVERVTDWACRALPELGFDVRTFAHDLGGGQADGIWPSLGEPLGIPIPTFSPRSFSRLCKALSWSDVVLIQNAFWPLSNVAGLALHRYRRPALTLIHANSATPLPDQARTIRIAESVHAHSLGQIQLRRARPIAICRSSQRFVKDHYHIDADVLPLPLPANLGPIGDVRPAGDPLRVVFSARLAPMKAPGDALHACQIARPHVPLRLDVFGDGPAMQTLAAAAPAWVTFHGARPWVDAVAAVAKADIFLSSSVTDVAQTSLLEALCLGVPSVATSVGEAPDYLNGPLAVGLGSPGHPDELAAAIVAVSRDYLRVRSDTVARAVDLRVTHDGQRCAAVLADYLLDAIADHVGRRS